MANRMTTVVLLTVAAYLVTCASGAGRISERLQKRFLGGGDDNENVFVSFDQSLQSVFDQVNAMNFTDDDEKRSTQTEMQIQFTEASQAGLKGFLETQGVQSESFWIANKMFVPNASPGLVNAIANFPGVASVEEEPVAHLDLPYIGVPEDGLNRSTRQSSVTWGIEKIRANQVWSTYKGRGVVVGGIDTGVRYTHETLRNNYRSSYGWYDPFRQTSTPNDQNGHGTHTMGTIAGSNGIGVAPEATWIACKGCSGNTCNGQALYICGQFMQCPTDTRGNNKDCTKGAQIVSNSWGGGQNDGWYDEIIQSWQNAGIIPVFSNGNSGPNCGTSGSPGDRPQVISVGSTESDNRISGFSSLGPAGDNRLKPDIAAPGGRVYSAWYEHDRQYNTISGTSMACPHVAGVVALMKQKSRALNYNQIYNIITRTASKSVDTSTARTCGGRSGSSFPNNVFGHGQIDAVDAVGAS